jgi:ATP-binding protein involved in chromosome partitioning
MANEQQSCQCSGDSCSSSSATTPPGFQDRAEYEMLRERMNQIGHKIVVLSGKGGVGKSTVAVNLALTIALTGRKVGLLDVDIHGPSVPKLLGLEEAGVQMAGDMILPLTYGENLKVMSLGFLLKSHDDALIWRGPMKMGVIKQFLTEVNWGTLDYLIVDSPPGTGDEPLSVCQLIENPDGAIIVTTPQDLALLDVRKSITFCQRMDLPVLGVVENMSGFVCPQCGEVTEIFKSGGGEAMAKDMHVPFLGCVPLDPAITQACDEGKPFIYHYRKTATAQAFENLLKQIPDRNDFEDKPSELNETHIQEISTMRIAIPVTAGKLSLHFGHCEQFALLDVNSDTRTIETTTMLSAPAHEPGLLPRWLAEQGANMIIAGGMGQRAQTLFTDNGIQVVIGAPVEAPDIIVKQYLDGSLTTGENICDH